MARIVISTIIDRTPTQVWSEVEDIGSHVTWMQDASAIRFTSEQTAGAGTRFECDTKVGPISLTDKMEITSWDEGTRMGVRHDGLVSGTGEFTLRSVTESRTEFRWEEDLRFPWWLGGPIGEILAKPILTAIWRGNLRRLRARIEG
jgi:hypothetical protein